MDMVTGLKIYELYISKYKVLKIHDCNLLKINQYTQLYLKMYYITDIVLGST